MRTSHIIAIVSEVVVYVTTLICENRATLQACRAVRVRAWLDDLRRHVIVSHVWKFS